MDRNRPSTVLPFLLLVALLPSCRSAIAWRAEHRFDRYVDNVARMTGRPHHLGYVSASRKMTRGQRHLPPEKGLIALHVMTRTKSAEDLRRSDSGAELARRIEELGGHERAIEAMVRLSAQYAAAGEPEVSDLAFASTLTIAKAWEALDDPRARIRFRLDHADRLAERGEAKRAVAWYRGCALRLLLLGIDGNEPDLERSYRSVADLGFDEPSTAWARERLVQLAAADHASLRADIPKNAFDVDVGFTGNSGIADEAAVTGRTGGEPWWERK